MSERKPSEGATYEPLPGEADLQMDAKAMKAFAHPLRMAMYSYLNDQGSATATMLARHLGESTGQTSYHLRQLEKHGLVSEDTGRGSGRERWWKPVGFSMRPAVNSRDAANGPALDSLMEHQLNERVEAMRGWVARMDRESPEWMDASVLSASTSTMTAAESRAMVTELMQVIDKHTTDAKERARSDGDAEGETPDGRRIRLYLSVFPLEESGR